MNDVFHRPGCPVAAAQKAPSTGRSPSMVYRYCPGCGISLQDGYQVVVKADTVVMESDAYPTIIKFMGTNMQKYRYVLRSDIAKIYLESAEDELLATLVDFAHGGEITLQDWAAWMPEGTGYRFVLDGQIPEKAPKIDAEGRILCSACGGTGVTTLLANSAEHHFEGDAPIEVEDACGNCEGSGFEPPEPCIPSEEYGGLS